MGRIDGRARDVIPRPGPKTITASRRQATGTTSIIAGRGDLVDLGERRRQRLLRDLGLEPTVQVPCGPGPCRCYGGAAGWLPSWAVESRWSA
jgi:hypothetical protein